MIVKAILDTDILSEYLKGHNLAVAGRAADYAGDHGMFTFTSVTVYEIVYGLQLKGASSQLTKIMAWLKQNEEITPIAPTILRRRASKLRLGSKGSVVGLPDCL